MSLESIELLTKEHAADRDVLAERVRVLHDELEQVKRRKLAGIKAAVSKARDSRLQLHSAIEHGKAAFEKPRTRVFHGIKIGLQKGKGKLRYLNAERTIELIRKLMPDQEATLVKVVEKPVKAALAVLSAADLKKLGCEIQGTGDQVVIEPINTEIDALVEALLGDKSDEADDEEEDAA